MMGRKNLKVVEAAAELDRVRDYLDRILTGRDDFPELSERFDIKKKFDEYRTKQTGDAFANASKRGPRGPKS